LFVTGGINENTILKQCFKLIDILRHFRLHDNIFSVVFLRLCISDVIFFERHIACVVVVVVVFGV